MTAKHLTVYSVNPSNMKRKKLAEFSFHGNKVTSHFEDNSFKYDMEEEGIVMKGHVFKPDSGAKFMDALEAAYSRSSTIAVEAK